MNHIREILNVFQEGVIEGIAWKEKDLNFKIECRYLADQISPEFSCFYIVLKNVQDFYFVPWDDEMLEIRDIEEIRRLRPDILSSEMADDFVKVYSNCQQVYSGGNIFILAKGIRVFDEDLRELGIHDLLELADKYWYSNYKAEG
jgi:hypothetical protein